jgi:hypothetical protein
MRNPHRALRPARIEVQRAQAVLFFDVDLKIHMKIT